MYQKIFTSTLDKTSFKEYLFLSFISIIFEAVTYAGSNVSIEAMHLIQMPDQEIL